MNIYVIYGNDMFDINDDCSIDKEYISHKEFYSTAQFTEICRKAKEDCKRKYNQISLFCMMVIMTELYGFEKIVPCAGYEL